MSVPAALSAVAFAIALLPAPAALAEQLSTHAFQKLVDRVKPAVVRVVEPVPGSAVIIGVGGELLAPAPLARKGSLTVEVAGEKRRAKLVASDPALGLALLALDAGEYPAATVGSAGKLAKDAFLVGVAFSEAGKFATAAGHFTRAKKGRGATHLVTDVAGPSGSAVFNSRGELVAVHAGSPRATIPIEELRSRFAPPARSP
jgi:S1-C subfamily serine protease